MASLSRASRPIGPVYNDTNRAARKLRRQGFEGAAERLALQGAEQQLAGGGSNITSAEGNLQEREEREAQQSGLMRERANVAFRADGEVGGDERTVAASGDQLKSRQSLYERMRSGITSGMRAEAADLGITDSGFAQASARAGKNPLAATTPSSSSSPAPLDIPIPGGVLGAAEGAQAYDEATRRLAMRAAEDKITGAPKSGAAVATQNIEKLGLGGAIADYHKRSGAAAQPPEPGNLAELKARDAKAVPGTAEAPVGPLHRAMLEARAGRARRESYTAADEVLAEATAEVGAKQITAGLNSSPAPTLDTSFTRRATPSAALPSAADERVTFFPPARGYQGLKQQGYTDRQSHEILKGQEDPSEAEDKRRKAAAHKLTRMGNTTLPRIPISPAFEDTAAGAVARYLNR